MRQAHSMPNASACRNSVPLLRCCSARASSAGATTAVGCTTVARCVSSKSSTLPLTALINAALSASEDWPRPNSVARGGPAKSTSVAHSLSVVSSRQPPSVQPSQLSMARRASFCTLGGSAVHSLSTMKAASSALMAAGVLWGIGDGAPA